MRPPPCPAPRGPASRAHDFAGLRVKIDTLYEGCIAKPELPTNVYRVDGKSGTVSVVAGDIARPIVGILLS